MDDAVSYEGTGYVKLVKYSSDAALDVRFYKRCKENGEGVPYGEPMLWVEIKERNSGTRPPETVDRLAGPPDIERFPAAYAKFQAEGTGRVINIIGTPIGEVEGLDAHAIKVVRQFGIEYAEQLAAANHHLLSSFGPYGHNWQKAAQQALQANPAERLAKAQEAANKQIEEMQKKIAELQQFTVQSPTVKSEGASDLQPAKRGRPAKVVNGDTTTDN